MTVHYDLFGVFVSMFAENTGVPFPIEGAFIIAQKLIMAGRYNFWFMYGFIVVSQTAGAFFAYWIGSLADKPLVKKFKSNKHFRITHAKITYWYSRHGSLTVLAARLIGYVRPWSSFVAGIAHLPPKKFIAATIAGTAFFVYPAMKLTGFLADVWTARPGLHVIISLTVGILFFGGFLSASGKAIHKHLRKISNGHH